jgi:hypothetical protein
MKKPPASNVENKKITNQKYDPRRLYSAPWVPIIFATATSAAIIHNNSFPLSPLYFFILFIGVWAILRLGALRGGLMGLVLISIWITMKLVYGAWSVNGLPGNVVELALAGLTFVASSVYHNQIKAFLNLFAENQRRMKNLDVEDREIGLIKSTVGLVRLKEEEERSTRYKRQFSLILIQVRPVLGIEWTPADVAGLMRTLASTIKGKIREVDIPFLLSSDRVGLILPETEANGARKVVNNIVNSMMNVRYVPQSGSTVFMWEYAQIRFGFSVFLGRSNTRINMLEAAERSLKLNLKTNPGDLYQNVFIEWETVGESALDVQAPPAAPEEVVVPLDAPTVSVPDGNDKKTMIVRVIERLRSL